MNRRKDIITVLIVEDEKSLSQILKFNIELEGYLTIIAENGLAALELFKQKKIELVLLDVMLPNISGFDVCVEMKKVNPKIPIIFLSAKSESEDRIRGLRNGADDYLIKPFNLEELLLRINNVLKRNKSNQPDETIEFGCNKINFFTWEFCGVNNQSGTLTKKEIQLIKLLYDKKNKVVSRDEIIENLWGEHENSSSRTIDNLILNFRKYFEVNPREPKYFHAIRGVGYKFNEKETSS